MISSECLSTEGFRPLLRGLSEIGWQREQCEATASYQLPQPSEVAQHLGPTATICFSATMWIEAFAEAKHAR